MDDRSLTLVDDDGATLSGSGANFVPTDYGFIGYGSYALDPPTKPPFNTRALYYENGDYISFDVNHQNIGHQLLRRGEDSWGDSLSWLNIDSTGMMTGTVPSYFDEGGGNAIAVTDQDGNQRELQSSFTVEPRFDV